MAAADKLVRVDVLDRQQPADTDRQRNRDDARHHQIIVAGHFENQGDGSHGGAGAAADHRCHADDRAGGGAEAFHRMNGVHQDAEGGAQRRAHEQRRRKNPAGRAGAEADGSCRELCGKQYDQQRRQIETASEDRLHG